MKLDLHDVVPEPPEDLLDWPSLDRRICRRRRATNVVAAGGVAVFVAGSILAATSISSHDASAPSPTGPINRSDGKIVFARHIAGSTRYLPETSLYSLDPRTGRVARLTARGDEITTVAASPDGTQIAYAQEVYGVKNGHKYVDEQYVHVANADGSADRQVYRCIVAACGDLVWSPDSSRLLINGNRIIQPDGQIMRLCVGPCSSRRFTDNASWSPDGRRLAFDYWKDVPLNNGQQGAAGTSTVASIGVMNADGSRPRLLTNQACTAANTSLCTDDSNAIWSPDGSVIAFTRQVPTYLRPNNSLGGPITAGPPLVETVRPDGSAVRQVGGCGAHRGIQAMSWSSAGTHLAFICRALFADKDTALFTLHRVDVETSGDAAEPLTFLTDEMYPQMTSSPSGAQLLISGRVDGPTPGIWSVRIEPELERPTQLQPAGYPPFSWLPARR